MKKPRVIIVDTDEKYIVTMQLKFAKDYFDLMDIEVITDMEYFSDMFSSPQRAEILIISEKLYSVELRKHDILKVFVMQEQYEEEQTGDLNIIKLFKYSSIQKIVSEIISRSSDVLNIDEVKNKDTQVIAVTSASGGCGKTTVAMGISVCLAKSFKKVLYINASELQTFQCLLSNATPIMQSEVYASIANNPQNSYFELKKTIRKEIFDYIPPFRASLLSLGLSKNIFFNIIKQAKESRNYDYIIVDTNTVFDEFLSNLIGLSDKTIFLLNQDVHSISAMNILMSNINGYDNEKYIFICNNYDKQKQNDLISGDISVRFSISEYIEKITSEKESIVSPELMSSNVCIKKIAFLIA